MKRFLMVLVLVAFAAGAAEAGDMRLGFKGGMNLAKWSGDDTNFFDLDAKMKMAFGGGVWFNYSFTDVIAVQPEMMFMMKGTKWEQDDVELKANFNYFDMNLLAKAYIPMEGELHPFFVAGPQIGFLSSAKLKAEVDGNSEEMDVKDAFKSTSFGLVFGAGLDYVFETNCISLDIRYAMDMGSIADEDDVDIKNTGFQFFVGYGYEF